MADMCLKSGLRVGNKRVTSGVQIVVKLDMSGLCVGYKWDTNALKWGTS